MPGSADGTGSTARFNNPDGVALDSSGNVYVGDSSNNTIRKITPTGSVSTLAGLAGSSGSADGTGSAARFYGPSGIAVDSAGNVYVGDFGNETIRKVNSAGVVSTLAGSAGSIGSVDGVGNEARFFDPAGVAVDSLGNVYVGDYGNCTIRKISPAGVVSTLAGSAGSHGSVDGTGSAARFNSPGGVAVDRDGNVYVADSDNAIVRKITPAGVVTTLAGLAGSIGWGSADGTGDIARFRGPWGIAVDPVGNLYVSDYPNYTVRKVTPASVVTTLAGLAGSAGSADGTGSQARFVFPTGVAVNNTGRIYVADDQTIRTGVPGGVSIHSITNAISNPLDSIDAPLAPPADDNLLALEPFVGGLVADGVTPLLIELRPTVVPAQATSYQITIAVTGDQHINSLNGYLKVLQPATSGGGQFVPGDTLTVSPSHPLGFAYISGIKSEDVQFVDGNKELTVTLSATRNGDTTPTATVQFRIRKPPIVLVHGYNSSNDAWGSEFLATLRAKFPEDFVLPVEYGVQRTANAVDSTTNRDGSLPELAGLLDEQLWNRVEKPDSTWHQQ